MPRFRSKKANAPAPKARRTVLSPALPQRRREKPDDFTRRRCAAPARAGPAALSGARRPATRSVAAGAGGTVVAAHAATHLPGPHQSLAAGRIRRLRAGGYGPVSYTHLTLPTIYSV